MGTDVLQPGKCGPFTRRKDGILVKKIRSRLVYFGKDYDKALERWNREGADLLAGRTPRPDTDATTVRDACNAFLTSKAAKRDRGGIESRRWDELKMTCDLLIATFGKHRLLDDLHPDDFTKLRAAMAKRWKSPEKQKVEIGKVRSVFRHAHNSGVIDRPVRYGPDFDPPSVSEIRRWKAEKGTKLFKADEIRRLLLAGDAQDQAWVLLGTNCAYQNADIAALRLDHLDMDGGWATFTRKKNGVGRRAKLWPETVQALRQWLTERPQDTHSDTEGLVFITVMRTAWASDGKTTSMSIRFENLAERAGVQLGNGKGLATFRHVFRTQGGESSDPEGLAYVMGHSDQSIAAVYRHRISDERLERIADVVRRWLFRQPDRSQ